MLHHDQLVFSYITTSNQKKWSGTKEKQSKLVKTYNGRFVASRSVTSSHSLLSVERAKVKQRDNQILTTTNNNHGQAARAISHKYRLLAWQKVSHALHTINPVYLKDPDHRHTLYNPNYTYCTFTCTCTAHPCTLHD